MGNIFTSFFSRWQELSPDQALQTLYDALSAQSPVPIGSDGAAPVMPDLTFTDWCRRLGLPRYQLDRYIRKELGCSGQELVDKLYSSR